MSKLPPLNDRTKQELAGLAKRRGIPGWERMRKEELIRALATPAKAAPKSSSTTATKPAPTKTPAIKATARTATPGKNGTSHHPAVTTTPPPPVPVKKPAPAPAPVAKTSTNKPALPTKPAAPTAPARVAPPPAPAKPAAKPEGKSSKNVRPEPQIPSDKDLSAKSAKGGLIKDRILLTSPDPYWLHAYWELSLQAVQRAEAALGQDWHGAKPIIRLFDVTSQDTTSTSEAPIRDIVVHGGCDHWYIDVAQPPRSYRADIGYLSRRGQFYVLARSNVQIPPKAAASESLDDTLPANEPSRNDRSNENGTNREMFDDQFRRPMKETAFGSGAVLPGKLKKFFFDLDAELIVYGKTDPTASVTLQNEPVKLRGDGTFTMRFSLPDSRQIIPAVATAADGMEEQTIVLAVERNTKRLDPMIHDLYGEN